MTYLEEEKEKTFIRWRAKHGRIGALHIEIDVIFERLKKAKEYDDRNHLYILADIIAIEILKRPA